ncbi:hypothetical protein [Bartonella sp. B1099]|nr:hypothetical protein [Bartonella sp. B1099]
MKKKGEVQGRGGFYALCKLWGGEWFFAIVWNGERGFGAEDLINGG